MGLQVSSSRSHNALDKGVCSASACFTADTAAETRLSCCCCCCFCDADRSAGSLSLIRELIAGSHTSCVRLQDGSPVAWMLEAEPLCAGT